MSGWVWRGRAGGGFGGGRVCEIASMHEADKTGKHAVIQTIAADFRSASLV